MNKITDVRFNTQGTDFWVDIIINNLFIIQAGSNGVYVPSADEIFVDKTFQRKAHATFMAKDIRQILKANGVNNLSFDSLQELSGKY